MEIKGGYGIAMIWKRRNSNEGVVLHRVEMSVGRWELCKNLDQGTLLLVM